jgi:succinate-acetate transporter protein
MSTAFSASSEHAESATGVYIAPLALSSLALTTFFLGADKAGLFATAGLIGYVFLLGGLLQFIVGIRSGNTIYSTAFAMFGVFWLAYGAWTQFAGAKGAGANELGYFFLAWTVFAGIIFLGSMRANLAHIASFLLFFLTFLAMTIAAFGSNSTFYTIGGWIGIVTAVVASYTVLATLESPLSLPTGIPS